MKFCSDCRLCYEDSIDFCEVEDHLALTQARKGERHQVEGYRIDSRIDSGFPVEFYKATHLASEKRVLIRFIQKDDSCAELKKELKAVAEINHPNLARVFEIGEIGEGEIFVVSEEIGGQNLGEFLQKISPLLERDAIQITRQIAEGLEELHSAGIVHRAVNPRNIYFKSSDNYNFEVRLQNYDFGGLIQKQVSEGANGIDAKTELFRYYSPEQFTNKDVNFSSDIYSLSVVFYEMLLGRSPYESLNQQAISTYVFQESIVEELHHDLRALLGYTLRESLHHKTDLRPQTTNNFVRQLRHLELVATPAELSLIEEPHLPKQKISFEKGSPIDLKIDDFDIEPRVETVATNGHYTEPFELDLPDMIVPISGKTKQLKPAESEFEIIEYNKSEVQRANSNNLGLIDDLNFAEEGKFLEEKRSLEIGEESLRNKAAKAFHAKRLSGVYRQPYFSSIIKSSFYVAGLIVLVFFGGFVTARIFEERGVVSSSSKTISVVTDDPNSEEQIQEDFSTEKLKTIEKQFEEDSKPAIFQNLQENNLQATEKISKDNSTINTERKIISSKTRSRSPKEISSKKKASKLKTGKAKVKNNKQVETPDEKAKAKTRPRFVPNEKIVIDPSKMGNGN